MLRNLRLLIAVRIHPGYDVTAAGHSAVNQTNYASYKTLPESTFRANSTEQLTS